MQVYAAGSCFSGEDQGMAGRFLLEEGHREVLGAKCELPCRSPISVDTPMCMCTWLIAAVHGGPYPPADGEAADMELFKEEFSHAS